MDENLLIDKKSKKIPLIPAIFLIFTVVLTIGIYSFNEYTNYEKNEISTRINETKGSIESIRSDKKIQIYELLKEYKSEISKYERNSDIVKYIDHLDEIGKKYGIKFSGFSISDGELRSEIIVSKVDSRIDSQSYEKVIKFIKNYREDKEALLDLKFINSFDGMDEIKFSVNFGIKNIIPTENKVNNTANETATLNDNTITNE